VLLSYSEGFLCGFYCLEAVYEPFLLLAWVVGWDVINPCPALGFLSISELWLPLETVLFLLPILMLKMFFFIFLGEVSISYSTSWMMS
jgi:hypothetical protein